MTEQEFIHEINRGKRVLCFTPEQCIKVIEFLVDRGYRLSYLTKEKFEEISPLTFDDSWLCPGLEGGRVTTWSYEYIQEHADENLSYNDFASLHAPSIEIDTEQLFEAIGI